VRCALGADRAPPAAQDDAARAGRLRRVQDNYQAQDEHAGGQQGNSMLALQRGELGRKKAGSAGTGAAAAKERERREQERGGDADADAEAHPGLAEQLTPPGPPILVRLPACALGWYGRAATGDIRTNGRCLCRQACQVSGVSCNRRVQRPMALFLAYSKEAQAAGVCVCGVAPARWTAL
jgi:hypothetical protein